MAALAQVAYPKYVVFMAENAYSSLIWDDKEIILPMFFLSTGTKTYRQLPWAKIQNLFQLYHSYLTNRTIPQTDYLKSIMMSYMFQMK